MCEAESWALDKWKERCFMYESSGFATASKSRVEKENENEKRP
jgi:hypothetical protein